MGARDVDGPWFNLPDTSSSFDNKITHGESEELRSHTEQFRSTNWSSMDPVVDFPLLHH